MLLLNSSEWPISPSGLGTPMTVMVMKTHTVSVLCHYNKHLLTYLLTYFLIHQSGRWRHIVSLEEDPLRHDLRVALRVNY